MDSTNIWELAEKTGGVFKLTVLLQKRVQELVRGAPKLVSTAESDLMKEGKNPLQLDSKAPTITFPEYAYSETRYKSLKRLDEKHAAILMEKADESTKNRAELYQKMANMDYGEKK